jgi:hypothetical protein
VGGSGIPVWIWLVCAWLTLEAEIVGNQGWIVKSHVD